MPNTPQNRANDILRRLIEMDAGAMGDEYARAMESTRPGQTTGVPMQPFEVGNPGIMPPSSDPEKAAIQKYLAGEGDGGAGLEMDAGRFGEAAGAIPEDLGAAQMDPTGKAIGEALRGIPGAVGGAARGLGPREGDADIDVTGSRTGEIMGGDPTFDISPGPLNRAVGDAGAGIGNWFESLPGAEGGGEFGMTEADLDMAAGIEPQPDASRPGGLAGLTDMLGGRRDTPSSPGMDADTFNRIDDIAEQFTPLGVSAPDQPESSPGLGAAPGTVGAGGGSGGASGAGGSAGLPSGTGGGYGRGGGTSGGLQEGLEGASREPGDPLGPTQERTEEERGMSFFERVFGAEDSDKRGNMGKALMMAGGQIMASGKPLGEAIGEGIQAGIMTYDEAKQALQEEERYAREMGLKEEAHEMRMRLQELQLRQGEQSMALRAAAGARAAAGGGSGSGGGAEESSMGIWDDLIENRQRAELVRPGLDDDTYWELAAATTSGATQGGFSSDLITQLMAGRE